MISPCMCIFSKIQLLCLLLLQCLQVYLFPGLQVQRCYRNSHSLGVAGS